MEKDVESFYAKKGLHVEKLVRRRPRELAEWQVRQAAAAVY